MALKDILEKVLIAHSDVFADCENAFVYGGRKRLKAEDLHPAPTESFYRKEGTIHNQFNDVGAYLMEMGKIKLHYIIGNETALEGRQVLRKASCQGGIYRAQLESGKPVYPVIGMVIYYLIHPQTIARNSPQKYMPRSQIRTVPHHSGHFRSLRCANIFFPNSRISQMHNIIVPNEARSG